MWADTTGGKTQQTKDHNTSSLRCIFCHAFLLCRHTGTGTLCSLAIYIKNYQLPPPAPFPLLLSPSPPLMSPGAQTQQTFRSEPRNLTVCMLGTAVLKCEVLWASGTVQWVKKGLLLGPDGGLPGFPRYYMIGNPMRVGVMLA